MVPLCASAEPGLRPACTVLQALENLCQLFSLDEFARSIIFWSLGVSSELALVQLIEFLENYYHYILVYTQKKL